MKKLKIRLTFTDIALGTASADKNIHETFIASKAPDAPNRNERIAEEIEAVGLAEATEKKRTIFPRTENGEPIIWHYQLKGFFKEACSALQRCKGEDFAKESCSIKAYKKVVDKCIFITPDKLVVNVHGEEEEDCQRPLRGQTAQGEKIALASSDAIPKGSTIEFSVVCLSDKHQKAVIEWLNYGVFSGLLQWRNSGKGRFTYEILDEKSVSSLSEAAAE